jgi:hypothetical protein
LRNALYFSRLSGSGAQSPCGEEHSKAQQGQAARLWYDIARALRWATAITYPATTLAIGTNTLNLRRHEEGAIAAARCASQVEVIRSKSCARNQIV